MNHIVKEKAKKVVGKAHYIFLSTNEVTSIC